MTVLPSAPSPVTPSLPIDLLPPHCTARNLRWCRRCWDTVPCLLLYSQQAPARRPVFSGCKCSEPPFLSNGKGTRSYSMISRAHPQPLQDSASDSLGIHSQCLFPQQNNNDKKNFPHSSCKTAKIKSKISSDSFCIHSMLEER